MDDLDLTPMPRDAQRRGSRRGPTIVLAVVLAVVGFVLFQGLSGATLFLRQADAAVEERDDLVLIDAVIWVEKDSHRGIVVGRGGEQLKRISTNARMDLEAIFERRFYVKAQVKVKENWSDNASALRQLGYETPQ